MKQKLTALIEAIIKGETEEAEKLLHEYLTAKSRNLIEGEDHDEEDEDSDEEDSDEDGDDDDSDDEEDDSDSDEDDDDEDEDEDDDDEDEEEEELTRKGRRTDKASHSRTRKK